MRILPVALLVLVSLAALVACGEEKVPEPTLTSTDTQVEITGTGTAISPPFQVKLEGSYKAFWKASAQPGGQNDTAACPMKAEIVSAQKDFGFSRTISNDSSPSTEKPGMMEAAAFRLQPMRFGVNVTTNCSWQVVLERQLKK